MLAFILLLGGCICAVILHEEHLGMALFLVFWPFVLIAAILSGILDRTHFKLAGRLTAIDPDAWQRRGRVYRVISTHTWAIVLLTGKRNHDAS